jgi:putative addiction module component (TIGR02574 family)
MRIADIPGIESLSTSEIILLVEDLWDSIADDESTVPVPAGHKEELDRRMERYMAHTGDLLSIEDLQRRINRRK